MSDSLHEDRIIEAAVTAALETEKNRVISKVIRLMDEIGTPSTKSEDDYLEGLKNALHAAYGVEVEFQPARFVIKPTD